MALDEGGAATGGLAVLAELNELCETVADDVHREVVYAVVLRVVAGLGGGRGDRAVVAAEPGLIVRVRVSTTIFVSVRTTMLWLAPHRPAPCVTVMVLVTGSGFGAHDRVGVTDGFDNVEVIVVVCSAGGGRSVPPIV